KCRPKSVTAARALEVVEGWPSALRLRLEESDGVVEWDAPALLPTPSLDHSTTPPLPLPPSAAIAPIRQDAVNRAPVFMRWTRWSSGRDSDWFSPSMSSTWPPIMPAGPDAEASSTISLGAT